jgi:hypothetical protein
MAEKTAASSADQKAVRSVVARAVPTVDLLADPTVVVSVVSMAARSADH